MIRALRQFTSWPRINESGVRLEAKGRASVRSAPLPRFRICQAPGRDRELDRRARALVLQRVLRQPKGDFHTRGIDHSRNEERTSDDACTRQAISVRFRTICT